MRMFTAVVNCARTPPMLLPVEPLPWWLSRSITRTSRQPASVKCHATEDPTIPPPMITTSAVSMSRAILAEIQIPHSCPQKVAVQCQHGAPWRCAMSLPRKYALVTGSSRGMGWGIALNLAEQRAQIALQHSHAAYLNVPSWFASRNPGAHHLQEETGIGGIGKQGGCVRTREHQHSRPGTYDLQIVQQAALVVGQKCPTDYGNVEFVRSSREDCLVPIVGDAHSKPGMREYAVSRSQDVGIGTDGEHSGLARHPALLGGAGATFPALTSKQMTCPILMQSGARGTCQVAS